MNEPARANHAYGALTEGLFIAGFTLERAFKELEGLLDGDDWRLCGDGFDDVNAFMATVRFDQFKALAEDRKRIAKRIKKLQPAASNRAIAKTLGVDEGTVRKDVAAENSADQQKKRKGSKGEKASRAENSAPPSGAQAAKIVEQRESRLSANERRDARLEQIAAANTDLPTGKRYPVILADPPWRYENPPIGASNRSIENHYPTMTLDEICALKVSELAAEDSILYLWATAPKLAECMRVIEAWGFVYRTNFVWIKDKIGMGYHARNQHEILLVAKRGEIPPPAVEDRVSSVVEAPRGSHSEKPAAFHELIEQFYPTLAKIELFSRAARDGWESWGNQAAAKEAAA